MNLLEPRIAPEFYECGVTSAGVIDPAMSRPPVAASGPPLACPALERSPAAVLGAARGRFDPQGRPKSASASCPRGANEKSAAAAIHFQPLAAQPLGLPRELFGDQPVGQIGTARAPQRPTPWLRVQFYRTGLCPKFPASRESAGNFCRFRLPRAILTQIRHANSMAYTKIPYAAEQGIFAG